MRHKPLLHGVLQDILPSTAERKRVLSQVKIILANLNKQLKKNKLKAKAVLGGSYAKDTWLAGDYDVDVFVKFAVSHINDNISDLLEKSLKKWKYERLHGSRDYFWIRDSIKYELVPVLDIKRPAQAANVTDFSPGHVEWVNKKGKNLKNDIRLTKKFCKGTGCYGAESYIRGFSGHVVDILTIYYKGFIPLLKAAAKWKPKVVLDYNKVYKGKALLMMNTSKTQGPLVLVDPIQPGRNAAAALTDENIGKFIAAARKFLKKPNKSFFVETQVDFAKLKKKGHFMQVAVKTLKDKEDVAGTKFVRAFEYAEKTLADFDVKEAGWLWDKKQSGTWWFVLGKKQLPAEKLWMGPPLKIPEAVKKFKRIYKKTFTKKGRLWTKVTVKERTPVQVLRRVVKEEYITSRVKSVNV